MDYRKIGLKIAEARIKNNMTQEELGEQIGKTSQFVSNIETGKRKPSLPTLLAISEKFKLSLDYLIYDINLENEMKNDIYMKQIYMQLNGLDNQKKQKLLDIIEFLIKKI